MFRQPLAAGPAFAPLGRITPIWAAAGARVRFTAFTAGEGVSRGITITEIPTAMRELADKLREGVQSLAGVQAEESESESGDDE